SRRSQRANNVRTRPPTSRFVTGRVIVSRRRSGTLVRVACRNAGGPGAGPLAWTLLQRDPDLASRGRSGRASICGARESDPSAAGTGRFQSAMSRSLPRSIFRVTFLVLATASAAWARCGVSHQLADLEARPTRCSAKQLVALQQVLANRLQFRESLD